MNKRLRKIKIVAVYLIFVPALYGMENNKRILLDIDNDAITSIERFKELWEPLRERIYMDFKKEININLLSVQEINNLRATYNQQYQHLLSSKFTTNEELWHAAFMAFKHGCIERYLQDTLKSKQKDA